MKNRFQPYLFWLLLLFFAIGLFNPVIGLVALTCMLAPVVFSVYKGRFWCGNYCPRGSFYDHVIAKISPNKPIPKFFFNPKLRSFMVIFLITLFSWQMFYAWGNWSAMGMVLIRIILVTTIVGIILGVIYNQRTWCAICPMGTLASWIAKRKKPMPLKVEESCVNCNLCTKACPLQLTPHSAKGNAEGFSDSDCLKCDRCVDRCPKKSLRF